VTTPNPEPKLEQRHFEALEYAAARIYGLSLGLDPDWEKILKETSATLTELPAILRALVDEIARLRDSIAYVHGKFTTDLAQGYRTKDKEFAVAILGKALEGDNTTTSPQAPAVGDEDPQPYFDALLKYTAEFYGVAISKGLPAAYTANAIAHVERAARNLLRIATKELRHD
jgi:hypothetical protein